MYQFNKNSDKYQVIREKIRYPDELYDYIFAHCKSFNSALDIGCGNGVSTVYLNDKFDYVEGQDIGDNLIADAKSNFPEITFKVSPAEEISSEHTFDLITSATSFYWMDRDKVIKQLAKIATPNALFVAYKYDFPMVYGKLRNFIEGELSNKWSTYRDERLENYDATKEILAETGVINNAKRFIIPNIIQLTPEEVGLFFLSTSYVTKYIEDSGNINYPSEFMEKILALEDSDNIYVNFDIHGFSGEFK